MKTNTMVCTDESVVSEINGFGMKVLLASAVIVGIWGLVCLVAGLVSAGGAGLVSGLMLAMGV